MKTECNERAEHYCFRRNSLDQLGDLIARLLRADDDSFFLFKLRVGGIQVEL